MKKILIGIGLLSLLLFGGYKLADYFVMGGEAYYVQITTDGEQIMQTDDKGNDFVDYSYTLDGYNEDGKEKSLSFNGNKERPLKKSAYLKVTWNKTKGVTSYEEVQKNELPAAAKNKLESAGDK